MSPRGEPTQMIHFRAPPALIARLDALVETLADDDRIVYGGRISRSAVLRLAVVEGIKMLERGDKPL